MRRRFLDRLFVLIAGVFFFLLGAGVLPRCAAIGSCSFAKLLSYITYSNFAKERDSVAARWGGASVWSGEEDIPVVGAGAGSGTAGAPMGLKSGRTLAYSSNSTPI